MIIKTIAKNVQAKAVLYSIIVAIITLRETDCTIDPGLDSPFRWALNYLIAFDKKAFDHIQYTVGPLCMLKWPAPIGDHIIISTIFFLVMGSMFTYLFTWFYCQYRDTKHLIVPLLTSTIFIMVVNVDIVLTGCVFLTILYYRFLNKKGYVAIGLLLTVIGLYLKTSLFISVFFIWISFSAYLIKKKEFKDILWITASGIFLFFLAGTLLFSSFSGVINFVINNVVFALKYSDLLSLYPTNNWIALGICLSCIALTIILFIKQPGGFLMSLSSLCLFSAWKYSMGREELQHALYFFYLLVLLMILFLTVQRKNIHIGLLLFLTAICFYKFNLRNMSNYQGYIYSFPDVANFNDRVMHHDAFKQRMLEESKQSCSSNLLPSDWQKQIGKQTTDAFPWDLSIIYINDLTYRTRPCLQSQRLTMENDRADAASLKATDAPQYIIWHSTKGSKTDIDGLDDQYIPNTCPATMEALLTHYKLSPMANERFAVWEKQPVPSVIQKTTIDSINVPWGTWIAMPACDSGSIIQARVNYDNTIRYKFRSFLYKGLPVYIEYETDSGKILKYSFSQQCSIEGLFVNPLWTDNQLHAVHIKRVRFLNGGDKYFNGNISVVLKKTIIVPQISK